jgi:hypothetical protein
MKNITITVDEKTAAWARVHAAKQGKSVSRLISEMLGQHMLESREYDDAMRAWFARKPVRFQTAGRPYPARETLHDRTGLRRR